MNDDFKDEDIIIELQDMAKKAEEFQYGLDSYCQFMKEVFLNTSGLN